MLVPNHDVLRPPVEGAPFSTWLLFNRASFGWQEVMDSPYYLYEAHPVTRTFLHARSLASSLYLLLLMLMARRYAEACRWLEQCHRDLPFSGEEAYVFAQLSQTLTDRHPDALAA